MPGSLRRFLLQLSLACACGTSNYISSALSLFGTFQNNEIMSLLSSNAVPSTWRRLPIVDVGTNDGTNFTMPGSKVGHRVYSFEPSPIVYARMLRNLQQNGISVANDSVGFRSAKAGSSNARSGVKCDGISSVLGGRANYSRPFGQSQFVERRRHSARITHPDCYGATSDA